jgi:hypothetical protein
MIVHAQWLETLGAGTKLFVLDSGCRRSLLAQPPASLVNFSTKAIDLDCQHGDRVVELAMHVAPQCELHIGKVWDGRSTNWRQYERALRWALESKADVVNLSFAAFDVSQTLKDLIRDLDDAGCIVVAAWAGTRWPGDSPHVLPVGPSGVPVPPGVVRAGKLFPTLSGGHLEPAGHASYAAAVVSGVAACAKAAEPTITRQGLLSRLDGSHASPPTPRYLPDSVGPSCGSGCCCASD